MSKYFSVNAVSCGRADGFDAEIAFKIEDWSKSQSNVITNQRLISTGHKTREDALKASKAVCEHIETLLGAYVNGQLANFQKAKT